ncbi:hypothetical protein GIB67_028260 [Kingdonia uniflora]|uniref:Uncharacterized protein n=1 Tax=Kingdonia uniflora TaxID=39325 RepID=A0A7J7KZB1_9MAGN|nr:hypothetical protein GIB67_028260 [Kingdonia uniflora]
MNYLFLPRLRKSVSPSSLLQEEKSLEDGGYIKEARMELEARVWLNKGWMQRKVFIHVLVSAEVLIWVEMDGVIYICLNLANLTLIALKDQGNLEVIIGFVEAGSDVRRLKTNRVKVVQSNLKDLLLQCCMDDDSCDVRQSAFALLGDLAKVCPIHLHSRLSDFLNVATKQLNNPELAETVSVANNACWAIGELAVKVYSQRENNARIFQLFNEIENFKQGTQTLGMYYARLRSSWEELSHYDSFIEWPASAPSKNVSIPPTAVEIYAKIVEKTRVFKFLAGLNPDFEYARVHLLDRTPFPTRKEAHTYCLSDQSRRSPMPPFSEIPSETSAMAVRYAYPAPPSLPSQTSHTSSPTLSPLPAASVNSRPSRKKCDYCGKWGHLRITCHALHGRPAGYQPRPSQSSAHLFADSSVLDSLAFSALSQDEINRFRQLLSMSSTPAVSHVEDLSSPPSDPLPLSVLCESAIPPLISLSVSRPLQVYTRRHPRRQHPTPDCQASSVAPGLPPAIDSPLSGIEPSPTASIPVTTDDDSPVQKEISPAVLTLISCLVPILQQPEGITRSLIENTAITLGRIAMVCPEIVSPHMEYFMQPWCIALSMIRDDVEKEDTFRGLCAMVIANPPGALSSLPYMCRAIASWTEIKSEDLYNEVCHVLNGYKQMLGNVVWDERLAALEPLEKEKLSTYQVR